MILTTDVDDCQVDLTIRIFVPIRRKVLRLHGPCLIGNVRIVRHDQRRRNKTAVGRIAAMEKRPSVKRRVTTGVNAHSIPFGNKAIRVS